MQASSTLRDRGGAGKSDLPAAILALLIKGKALLFSLFKLKFLFSILSAVVSVFAYAVGFGWWGAIGFVALIFVHEMGHVIVLRSQGVPATVPLFIPFVGALIGMKSYPRSVVEEAYSAIAGPIVGSIGALVCFAAYFATGKQIWAWLAYIGFFLNLFNLLPMSPLDGGRIVGAVWRGFWILGIVAAVIIATVLESPVLLLFTVFGLSEINRRLMRVHWFAYVLLALMAIVSSAICDEIVWGVIVAIFAMTHMRRAQAYNAFVAAGPSILQDYRIKISRDGVYKYLTVDDLSWHNLLAVKRPCLIKEFIPKPLQQVKRRPGPVVMDNSEGAGEKYFTVPKQQRLIIGSMYVGLASVLTGVLCWMHAAGLFERPR